MASVPTRQSDWLLDRSIVRREYYSGVSHSVTSSKRRNLSLLAKANATWKTKLSAEVCPETVRRF